MAIRVKHKASLKSCSSCSSRRCTDCDFINLGMYNAVKSYAGVSERVGDVPSTVCVSFLFNN